MRVLYNTALVIYYLAVHLAAIFNGKAKKWIKGRKEIFTTLTKNSESLQHPLWIHASSLGEFEMARPLIDMIKEQMPEQKIIVSFYSPSGYEIRNNYENIDLAVYLPFDFTKRIRKFIQKVNPCCAIFIKYDLWLNTINELHKNNIPTYLVSANFREDQIYFKWYGKIFMNILHKLNGIFVQNEKSFQLLQNHNIHKVYLSGDLRFDRVYQTKSKSFLIPVIDKFKNNQLLFIAGSTWEPGDHLIINYILKEGLKKDIKFIIAPHQIHESKIRHILKQLNGNAIAYSQIDESKIHQYKAIVIDNIGMLSSLYAYGNIAYVGGGFGKSLHNVLEATTYGLPVLIGPNHYKFPEIQELIDKSCVFPIADQESFNSKLNELIASKDQLKIISEKAKKFVQCRTGCSQSVFNEIQQILRLSQTH
ncbi:MAG: 3-deoxy-D-manno-octulosonic acid transferase [Marinilabiliales bacterium]|nr:MAG: 3-deoxy-D-manno-octulosonic acid transferase [Marinilabiliales bacterium]